MYIFQHDTYIPTDQATDRQVDRQGHRDVSLPITQMKDQRIDALHAYL